VKKPTPGNRSSFETRATREWVSGVSVAGLSYDSSYHPHMTVVNFRTDERSERALAELTADGATVSDAIRQALVDAVRLRRREQMRRESFALANDPADLAESRQVLKEMDELRAW